jgi:ribosome-associated heat shock protein Hsp15
MSDSIPSTRVDRWLWAARAYKSRSQAADACDGGKVTVNDASAKPHKLVRPGDEVAFTTPVGKRIWRVTELAERRGPASVARTLYEDLTPPPPPQPVPDATLPRREPGSGRPTKRDRRQMRKFFG